MVTLTIKNAQTIADLDDDKVHFVAVNPYDTAIHVVTIDTDDSELFIQYSHKYICVILTYTSGEQRALRYNNNNNYNDNVM